MDKGVFSSGSVVYRIETVSKGWSVERKYKEFCELRVELERLHPGYVVPIIYAPANDKETNPDFIATVKPILQQFLDDVLRHPVLGCSELIFHFLHQTVQTSKKVDEFTKRLKLYSLMPLPKDVDEVRTTKGSAVVALTPELNTHIGNLHTVVEKLRQLYME